jgi:hypothetical protein
MANEAGAKETGGVFKCLTTRVRTSEWMMSDISQWVMSVELMYTRVRFTHSIVCIAMTFYSALTQYSFLQNPSVSWERSQGYYIDRKDSRS